MTGADIDAEIDAAAKQFVDRVIALMPRSLVIREGMQTQAVISFVWAMHNAFPDGREALIEALNDWEPTLNEKVNGDGGAPIDS